MTEPTREEIIQERAGASWDPEAGRITRGVCDMALRTHDAEQRAEQLQQQAETHAQEARTANTTIHEIYQLCTGATGEPGNWHGAEPVRQVVNELREAKQALRDVRPEIDSLIAGLHHSHVNPSDGIVHDGDVAHEISQLTELHERIVRLVGNHPRSEDEDGEKTRAVSLREQALEAIEAWEVLYEREKERAQRAEAECDRLRDALNDHHQWARTNGHEMGLGYLNSWLDIKTREALATPPPEINQVQRGVVQGPNGPTWYEKPAPPPESERDFEGSDGGPLPGDPGNPNPAFTDAPHTPEQTGEESDYLVEQIRAMPEWAADKIRGLMRGEDAAVSRHTEQAHGDALVDEIAPPIPPFNSEAEEEEYHCEAAVRHYSERVREKLRRHLTASGAQAHGDALLRDLDNITDSEAQGSPEYERIRRHLTAGGVSEEVRRLPEQWRRNPPRNAQDCAYDLESVLASAPAVPNIPESVVDEIVDEFEWMAEDADGRDASHTPADWERLMLKDFAMLLLSEAPNRIAAAPSDGRE